MAKKKKVVRKLKSVRMTSEKKLRDWAELDRAVRAVVYDFEKETFILQDLTLDEAGNLVAKGALRLPLASVIDKLYPRKKKKK